MCVAFHAFAVATVDQRVSQDCYAKLADSEHCHADVPPADDARPNDPGTDGFADVRSHCRERRAYRGADDAEPDGVALYPAAHSAADEVPNCTTVYTTLLGGHARPNVFADG